MNRNRMFCAFPLGLLLIIGGCDRAQDPGSDGGAKLLPKPSIGTEDCRVAIELKPLVPLEFGNVGNNLLPLVVSVANKGKVKWGGPGPDMRLGAVWFDGNKVGNGHTPNHGEQWWPLPAPVEPGEVVKFEVSLNVPGGPGDYIIYFSMLQPGVMWCFHVGDPPTKLAVRVKKPAR